MTDEEQRKIFSKNINYYISNMTFRQVVKSAVQDKFLPPPALDDIFTGVEIPRPKKGRKKSTNRQGKESGLYRRS